MASSPFASLPTPPLLGSPVAAPSTGPGLDALTGDAVVAASPASRPIDKLHENKDLHDQVRDRLLDRLEFSERAMSNLYDRWQYNENAVQAYVRLPDYEKKLKDRNRAGEVPQIVSVVVPYIYASLDSMATYLSSVLFGRRPLFQTQAGPGVLVENARKMEQVLQYNADHSRLVREGFQFIWDTGVYGMAAMQVPYVTSYGQRTVIKQLFDRVQRVKEQRLIYSGNMPEAIDPYKFFPDPRGPIGKVNRGGDFVFWRAFKSKLDLKTQEADGIFRGVSKITAQRPKFAGLEDTRDSQSNRNARIGFPNMGAAIQGTERRTNSIEEFVQLDQGVVKLIPNEWGLGDSKRVEMWLFTIGNKDTIVQAEPLDMDHGMAPVVTTEPWSFGYDFGALSATDYMLPFQESMSWFINSRIYNVRTSLNNMWLVDPSKIEMQDMQRPGPGKIIRLKRGFYGADVRMAVQQLVTQDVTATHVNDIQNLQRLADSVLGINDNLRGLISGGGRKSATEARLSAESGSTRLSQVARSISAEAMIDLAEQMCINIQQFMPDEMAFNVLGPDGAPISEVVRPDMIAGDFNFNISDGTLPLDKVALIDVWKDILLGVAQDPQLRAEFSLSRIFEYVAMLSGAKNIGEFKLQAPPALGVQVQTEDPEQIERDRQAGNVIPLPSPRTFMPQ